MKIRAGVVQIGAVPFNNAETIAKIEQWAARAGRDGCRILLFPEALVPAYPKGSFYDISVGVRTDRGRDEFRRYFDAAIDVPGPETDRIGEAAAAAGLQVVVGVIERELGTVHCTALFFDSDGTLLGKHRKLMPTAGERLIWGYGDGSTLPVFETPAGRMGAVICWENYMPMLRMAMYAKGIAVYCAPTADDRETWLPTMRHIAFEGRCFVLTACQVVRLGDFPKGYRCAVTEDPNAVIMHGGSAIIDPFGRVVAGPVFDEESLLTADLDTDDLTRAKFDFDVAGNYARPDVFTLTVDEAQHPAVAASAPDRPSGRTVMSGEESSAEVRFEHDLLGDFTVPASAYWGVQTQRAIENFRITRVPIAQFPQLIRALAMVKPACARANRALGSLNAHLADAIDAAAQEIIDGRLHDQFQVDVIQGGAGTSTNMNANEVIANRALEILGRIDTLSGWPVRGRRRYGAGMLPISLSVIVFPARIIQHAVWLYARFTCRSAMSRIACRRGSDVSNETVRRWF